MPGTQRFWDGSAWTGHVMRAGASAPPGSAPVPAQADPLAQVLARSKGDPEAAAFARWTVGGPRAAFGAFGYRSVYSTTRLVVSLACLAVLLVIQGALNPLAGTSSARRTVTPSVQQCLAAWNAPGVHTRPAIYTGRPLLQITPAGICALTVVGFDGSRRAFTFDSRGFYEVSNTLLASQLRFPQTTDDANVMLLGDGGLAVR